MRARRIPSWTKQIKSIKRFTASAGISLIALSLKRKKPHSTQCVKCGSEFPWYRALIILQRVEEDDSEHTNHKTVEMSRLFYIQNLRLALDHGYDRDELLNRSGLEPRYTQPLRSYALHVTPVPSPPLVLPHPERLPRFESERS